MPDQATPNVTRDPIEDSCAYSKDRYFLEDAHRSEYRSAARQLAASFVVVVGLAAVLGNAVNQARTILHDWAFPFAIPTLALFVIGLLPPWIRSIRRGYAPPPTPRPQTPAKLLEQLDGKDRHEILHTIRAEYAKAAEALCEDNQRFIADLRWTANLMGVLLAALFVMLVVVLFYGPKMPA